MEANKRRYSELVSGAVQFVIPVFQRDYNWHEEQCQQLWNDILRAGQTEHGEHFFGPVVYVSTTGQSAAFTRWLLIDGQQRMTTVSLLMAAIRDHISKLSTNSSSHAAKIEHDFLLNTFESKHQRRKLVLRERDDGTLCWLIGDGEEPTQNTGSQTVVQNYNFFREKLEDADTDVVMNGVGRLTIVDVRLKHGEDDPQQIFESLNSTGLDLTQGDLVRNYVLMSLDESQQTSLYRKYWYRIERLYSGGSGHLDNFLRDFVALDTRAQKQGRVDQVYANFRLTFGGYRGKAEQLEDLLQRMLKFARYHSAFVLGNEEFPDLVQPLSRVRALATTPAILIMHLLDMYDNQPDTRTELTEALNLLESYLVRRDICRLQTRSYWQQFARLAYALNGEDVLGSLKANLYWLADTNYAFPSDRDFRQALETEKLYGRQICRTLLERLENGNSKEQTDTSSLTIEHIMPQNEDLHPKWRDMLGEDWRQVQETWLHRLGNLTLTGYNETYSDKPFDEKMNVENGFGDSPLRLNQFVAQQDKWTANEMNARSGLLAKRALTIWAPIEVSDNALRRAEVRRLREQKGDVEITRQEMDDIAREIFDEFRRRVLEEDLIEVALPKSVSYHNRRAEMVCEILPRTHRILVLFNIAMDAMVECDLVIHDTADYKFIPHAQYDAACFVSLYTVEDIDACNPLLRQAQTSAIV